MNKISDKTKMKSNDITLMTAIMHITSIFIKYCSDNKA